MAKRKAVEEEAKPSKRSRVRPSTNDNVREILRSRHELLQPVETIEDSQQWLPLSPKSNSRKKKLGESSKETCLPPAAKNRRSSRLASKAIAQQEEQAQQVEQEEQAQKQVLRGDQALQPKQAAWVSVEDWIQIEPGHRAVVESEPQALALGRFNMADGDTRSFKRSIWGSSKSRSQFVEDDELPRQYTEQHEKNMRKFGMFMDETITISPAIESQTLYKQLLERREALPPWFVNKDTFLHIIRTFRWRTEASIFKTITRYIIPSPEVLSVERHRSFENITESNNATWGQFSVIHGIAPKPGTALGIKESVFSDVEQKKLHYHCTVETPTKFSEEMYFPFFICVVKSVEVPSYEIEMEAMHSASIAVRAIIELFRRNKEEKILDGRILVFSISHNLGMVKIYGHFPHFSKDKVTFHRKLVHDIDFDSDAPYHKWTRAYQFGLAVCEAYFPEHLKLIRDAVAKLPDPSVENLEPTGSQDAASSSQDNGITTKVRTSELIALTAELTKQSELLNQQSDLLKQQTDLLKQQSDLLKQRREQLKQQSDLLKQQSEQLKQQREQLKQQREQLAQQREESLQWDEKHNAVLEKQC